MAEEGLDALVVRAPDNVLYLTNFWGMKGYEAVVFPREGEPALICLEASAEDAARTAWTTDVRFLRGYADDDPRPPPARTLELARGGGARLRHGRARALARHAGVRPHGRRADDLHARLVRTRSAEAADATPLLARARAIKTAQELERMRLANEIAAAAMEHCREPLRPGMKESEAAAIWNGFVHGAGTGWHGQVELALGFSLVWSGPGIRTFTATGDRPVRSTSRRCSRSGSAPTATGATTRRTSAPASCAPSTPSSSAAARRLRAGDRPLPARREPRRARPARPRRHRRGRLPGPAEPSDRARRRRPRARAAVRAPGRRRHDRGGHGARDRAGHLLGGRRRAAGRGQLPRHRRRRREAVAVPGRRGARSDLDRRAERPAPPRRAGRPLRHDAARRRADGRRRPRPGAEARDRAAARRARDRPDRGRLPARLAGRLGGGAS